MSRYESKIVVIKRDGREEVVDTEKIYRRILYLKDFPSQLDINIGIVVNKTEESIRNRIKTSELDLIASKISANLAHTHPGFMKLALRLLVADHHKSIRDCFSEVMKLAYNNLDINTGQKKPLISKNLYKFIEHHKNNLNSMVDYKRDFRLTLFGFSTLLGKYLLKASSNESDVLAKRSTIIESPQDMFMRVACAIHMNYHDLRDDSVLPMIEDTYNLISQGYHSMASPTLFNSGTKRQQLLSCFLTSCEDSTDSICHLQTGLAKISKNSGGIGFWWPLRSAGEPVYGINGFSSGPISMLPIMEATALGFDQGSKRPGSFASYEKPFHPDFLEWVKCRRPASGKVRHLFYACWIPDIFMNAVENDDEWYFFDPSVYPAVYNNYDSKVNKTLTEAYYEGIRERKYKKSVRAREVWNEIILTQIQTGMPYMCYSDTVNRNSNQKNVGMIHSSNLCAEIVEYSDSKEWACCVLGTMCLPKYVVDGKFNYELLAEHSGKMAINLNKIIDVNWYPVKETKISNMRHRPIAIGMQGLADVFMMLRTSFTSQKARFVNKKIAEVIYYGALRASCDMAIKSKRPYRTFKGSPFSYGKLQFHHYGMDIKDLSPDFQDRWRKLISDIKIHGTVNSLVTGYPPTASSSNIQGNNECFEPYTNIGYVRKTLAGEFYIPCSHFVDVLKERKLYTPSIMTQLLNNNGSVQNLDLPNDIKEMFKTSWEISNRALIDMAADRQPFVDQSQSLNQWVPEPTHDLLTKIHFHGWRKGLKTGMYYLRASPKVATASFGSSSGEASKQLEIFTNPQSEKKVESSNVDNTQFFIGKKAEPWCDDHSCCSG
jgi:ribonucleoside-diphosphate reductase alpha chain